ncbi:MAG: serine hydrolase, partial [Pseudomonadota bacterium]
PSYAREIPAGQTVESLGVGVAAKILCSAIFISNRSEEEALANSVWMPEFITPDQAKNITNIDIDRDAQKVTLEYNNQFKRTALYTGSQGCTILPDGFTDVQFDPTPVKSRLPAAHRTDWPMGDKVSTSACQLATPVKEKLEPSFCDELQEAADIAFGDRGTATTSLLVVHEGNLIFEQYKDGITKDMPLESWSMGKSLTAILIGRLVQLGYIDHMDVAPIDEWRKSEDARKHIRISDLLQMSSGLKFSGGRFNPEDYKNDDYPEHMLVYTSAFNTTDLILSAPSEFLPGKLGRYRNSDPLALIHIMRTVLASDKDYLSFPQHELFDKVGARHFTLETDAWGLFLSSGYNYGTGRDWARLGQLMLNKGKWDGDQLIPEDYVEFVTTPAPGWHGKYHRSGSYGGQLWLNNGSYLKQYTSLPPDAYYFSGSGANKVMIIPSLDLVIVRMGHTSGQEKAWMTESAVYDQIIRAMKIKSQNHH